MNRVQDGYGIVRKCLDNESFQHLFNILMCVRGVGPISSIFRAVLESWRSHADNTDETDTVKAESPPCATWARHFQPMIRLMKTKQRCTLQLDVAGRRGILAIRPTRSMRSMRPLRPCELLGFTCLSDASHSCRFGHRQGQARTHTTTTHCTPSTKLYLRLQTLTW